MSGMAFTVALTHLGSWQCQRAGFDDSKSKGAPKSRKLAGKSTGYSHAGGDRSTRRGKL
jgi:hypothetical protein